MPRRRIPFDKFSRGWQPLDLTTAAGLLRAQGVRFRAGGFRTRGGLREFGTGITAGSGKPRFLLGNFFAGSDVFVAFPNKIYRYNVSLNTWTEVATTGLTLNATNNWTGATLFDRFFLSQGSRFLTGDPPSVGTAGILEIGSLGGSPTALANTPAANELFAYAGRLFALNTHDEDGNTLPYRCWYSSPGDPTDFYENGGYVDLAEDGYPLIRGIKCGGRAVLFKGNALGGSLALCSATSSTYFPVSVETIHGLGLLGARTLCRLGSDIIAFLSHDGMYLMQGSNSPEALSDFAVSRALIDNFDLSALDDAFCCYDPTEGDLLIHIPYNDGSLVCFTYNVKSKVWTGPEPFANLRDVISVRAAMIDSWDATAESDTWDAGDATSWNDTPETREKQAVLYVNTAGNVYAHDPNIADDAGVPVNVSVETGDMEFSLEYFAIPGTARGYIKADDSIAFSTDMAYLTYRDLGGFDLLATISADGGETWLPLFYGTIPGTGSNATRIKRLDFNALVGKRFRVRLQTQQRVEFVGLSLEVDYAGLD